MFVFDLFEKMKSSKPESGKDDLYKSTQHAEVRAGIDNYRKEFPGASDVEAAIGHGFKQDQINKQQQQEIDQLEKDERTIRKAYANQEKRFQDFNKKVADMDLTPPESARAAQDVEKGVEPDRAVSTAQDTKAVAPKPAYNPKTGTPPASTVTKTTTNVVPMPMSTVASQQPAQPNTTAPADPTTSKALGQMATQLTPGRVIKGKSQQAQPQQPVAAEPTAPADNVTNLGQFKADKAQKTASAFGSLGAANAEPFKQVANLEEQAPAGADTTAIAKYNIEQLSKAYMSDARSVNIEFPSGQDLALQNAQVHALVDILSTINDGPNKQALLVNLFSNRNFLIEWMFENILNKQAPQQPEPQQIQTDPEQLELHEGDVVPFTNNQETVQAYNDAMQIIKAAADTRVPDGRVNTMRQDFASKYQQRFQISQAPDRTYYLFDKQTNQRQRLPNPATFAIEDSWNAGDNAWSSEHNNWTAEDAQISPDSTSPVGGHVQEERLSVGDPVIVTAPNEFEGKTGEIAEFSPSGKFVIVNLYNHGEHSMHLSDVEYNQYADEEDEVDEGWSDAIVSQRTGQPRTPYSVYIKGKKWKDFENDDHAEAVANKLRAKFKADGRDPSVITIAATDYDKGVAEGKWSNVIHTTDRSDEKAQREQEHKKQAGLATTVLKNHSQALDPKEIDLLTRYNLHHRGKPGVRFDRLDNEKAQQLIQNVLRFNQKGVAEAIDTQAYYIANANKNYSILAGPFASREQGRAEFQKIIHQYPGDLKDLSLLQGHVLQQSQKDALDEPDSKEPWHGIKDPELLKDLIADAQVMDYDEFYDEYSSMFDDPEEFWDNYHNGEQGVAEAEGRVDPILIKALNRMPDGLATHGEVLNACYDAYAMELGRMEMKSNYGTTHAYIPQLMDLYKEKHGLTFNEEYTPSPAKPFRNPRGFNKQGTGVGNKLAQQNRYELERNTPVKTSAEYINRQANTKPGDPIPPPFGTKSKIQVKKNKGVVEGHADQQRKIFKKNGKPVGEVGIDRESSPGNGQWYMKHYASGKDNAGYDSYEEAVAELKHCMKQGVAEAVPTQAGAVDPKIQFLQPTIQFAEKLGYQVTLNPNPNGKIFVKLVNKQIEHTVRIGFSRGRDPGTKLEADMSDNWDSQTYAWSAKELAQDFKEFYKDALRDSPTQGQQGVAEGKGPQSKLDQKIIHLLTNGIPADAIARKLDIPVAWVDEVAEYNMPDSAIDYNDPRNTPPTNRFGEGVAVMDKKPKQVDEAEVLPGFTQGMSLGKFYLRHTPIANTWYDTELRKDGKWIGTAGLLLDNGQGLTKSKPKLQLLINHPDPKIRVVDYTVSNPNDPLLKQAIQAVTLMRQGQQGVAEAKTDYQKRREYEKAVELGKKVPKPRQSSMTDYQKRRAEQKRQEELGEDGEGTPEGLPHLTKELLSHIVDQVGSEGAHAIVKSLEWGDGAAEELLVLILKDLKQDISQEEIDETIRKVKGGYRLVSHTGKNLGTYPTKGGAEKRERQVQYFKHANESTNYWTKLQQDRDQRQHVKAYGLLESLQDVIKDIK